MKKLLMKTTILKIIGVSKEGIIQAVSTDEEKKPWYLHVSLFGKIPVESLINQFVEIIVDSSNHVTFDLLLPDSYVI